MKLSSMLLACMVAAGGLAEPTLKVGFMTDTHVDRRPASADRVRMAFEVFKANGAEVVVHCGDLADRHYPEAYGHYRKAIEDVYKDGAKRPELYYVRANHDAINHDFGKGNQERFMDFNKAFEGFDKGLGVTHPMMVEKKIKGVQFLILPQSWSLVGGMKVVADAIDRLCAENPGKPVVVCSHIPLRNTVQGSERWGLNFGGVFSKHPQVILFTGHSHGTLRHPRCVWQGEFTAVDTGCLQKWYGDLDGKLDKGKQAYEVYVAEFCPDKLVLRRFDVRDGSELDPDAPWTIPLPFDPATAPYTVANCRKRERPASFPPGALVDASAAEKGGKRTVTVGFPAVKDEDSVEKFRIVVDRRGEGGVWTPCATNEMFSSFYIRPSDRSGRHVYSFKPGALPGDVKDLRFTVTPVGFFGTEGAPLVLSAARD